MREIRFKSHFRGGIFHVYNRGIEGRRIFLDDDDFHSYLERLVTTLRNFNITLLAYCLMPNHVHLLLRQNSDTPAATLIQALHTSFVKRFNAKHRRFGHLFQERFRQAVVRNNAYLRHLIAYIHLNPVEAGLVARAEEYRWSSQRAYLGEETNAVVDHERGLALFDGKQRYLEFLRETTKRPRAKRWYRIREIIIDE